MPNVGKPSKGCKNCRERKVKCDQKRPSCSQCIRINKECHGYRDPLSIMFKNESEVVVHKAQRRYEELSKKKSQKPLDRKGTNATIDPSVDSTSNECSPSSSRSSLSPSTGQLMLHSPDQSTWSRMTLDLVPSVSDQALCFFYANYVTSPYVVPRGNFTYLSEMLNRPDTEPVLLRSLNATALAGFANATKSASIMKRAREEYGVALNMTNKALQSKRTAIKNSTLIAVSLLGLYENFTYENIDALQSWAKHVNGASALLTLRGEEQFQDPLGFEIFQHIYGFILLVSVENGTPLPESVKKLYDKASDIAATANLYKVHGQKWTSTAVKFMHDASNVAQDKTGDPATILEKAKALDLELDKVKAFIPSIWKYETVYLEEPAKHVFGNFYHIYTDPWITHMWNNLRICRMALHRTVREQILKGFKQYPLPFDPKEAQSRLQASEHTIRSIIAGVCASAPQYTGQIPYPDPSHLSRANETTITSAIDPQDPKYKLQPPGTFLNPLRPNGLHHLIFPVYAAGLCEFSPPKLKQWAIDQLEFLALKIGTRQAVVLAEDLKERQRSGSVSEILDDEGFMYTI